MVASLARPGGNITGLFLDLSELSGKQLEILKEIMPGSSRVAVLGDPDINAAPISRAGSGSLASLALQTHAVELKNATDLDVAFEHGARTGAPTLSSFRRIHSVSLTECGLENSRPTLACRRCTFIGRT